MQFRQLVANAAALMVLLGLAQVVAGLPTVCPPLGLRRLRASSLMKYELQEIKFADLHVSRPFSRFMPDSIICLQGETCIITADRICCGVCAAQ